MRNKNNECIFCSNPGEPVNLFIEENTGYKENWKINLKKEINLCKQHMKGGFNFTYMTQEQLAKAL